MSVLCRGEVKKTDDGILSNADRSRSRRRKKKQKEEQTKIRENSEKKSMKHLDML